MYEFSPSQSISDSSQRENNFLWCIVICQGKNQRLIVVLLLSTCSPVCPSLCSLIFQSICAVCLSLRAAPQYLLLLVSSILPSVLWSLHLSCTSANQSNLVCHRNKRPVFMHAHSIVKATEKSWLPHPTSTVLRTALDHS